MACLSAMSNAGTRLPEADRAAFAQAFNDRLMAASPSRT